MSTVVDRSSLAEFFHKEVRSLRLRHQLELADETEFYVVNLLTEFLAADKLHGPAEAEKKDEPLALVYIRALEAASEREQRELLKIIGDRSLYVSGFFADSFARRLIDVDYYVSMGEHAYTSVAQLSRQFAELFAELAEKFTGLVDLIGELSESAGINNDQDLLRLYERWLSTKSERLYRLLRAKGINPLECDHRDPVH